jgi:predicted TIM-barrel fold metal-dependent hydrolase
MRLFSADSHVNEPPQTWERVSKEFRDRGPRIVQDPPGLKGLYFIVEGLHPEPVGITFLAGKDIAGGKIAKEIDEFDWNQWQGPWNSAERLKDMDLDGVEAEVIYPSMARILNGLNDAPLQTASLKAYNDWLHEYCSHAPKRLMALAVLSVLDIGWSVKELLRCAKLGFKGVILPSALPDGESYSSPRFDPVWEAAQEIGLPVSFHENTAQGRDRGASARMGNTLLQRFRWRIGAFIEPQILLVDLIFGLVLERYPRLQFVFAEYELCWLGIILNMDANVGRMISPSSAKIAMLPSEYIKRQIHLTFLRDRIGALGTEVFGADTYMWSSDYPHRVSTWPKSQETAQSVLKGLPETVQRKLAWENGATLYGLS